MSTWEGCSLPQALVSSSEKWVRWLSVIQQAIVRVLLLYTMHDGCPLGHIIYSVIQQVFIKYLQCAGFLYRSR